MQIRLHLWRRALAGLMSAALVLPSPTVLAQNVRLPSLGESASSDLSVSAERRLGDQIMREARRDPAFLDDPVLLEYLQSLWSPLLAAARQSGNIDGDIDKAFAWEAFLVRDRSVNAFALPGGYVGMHLGLMAITTTPDQLASVLAHELAHVSQRHIARSIAPQQQASIVALAAIVLGILAAARTNNSDVANAAVMGGQGAAIQSQLNFSRDMEREADRVGYGVLGAAGYSPAGMASMFERMEMASRLNDNGGFPYLRSHPLTGDRISESRNRTLLGGGKPQPPTSPLHAMMQSRARVMMDDRVQSLQRLNGATSATQLSDRVGALYAGAMAASQLKDHARAESHVNAALQLLGGSTPRDAQAERVLKLLQAQVLLAKGDAARALAVLDQVEVQGGIRPVMLLRAQAAVDFKRSDAEQATAPLRASTEQLQIWVAEHAEDAAAWEALSGTADALGLKLRAMRAGAEARAAVGDYGGAIDRLRAAQNTARTPQAQDFIEASVIDTRLRHLTALRRQLALEARGEGRGGNRPEEAPTAP